MITLPAFAGSVPSVGLSQIEVNILQPSDDVETSAMDCANLRPDGEYLRPEEPLNHHIGTEEGWQSDGSESPGFCSGILSGDGFDHSIYPGVCACQARGHPDLDQQTYGERMGNISENSACERSNIL